VFAPVGVCLTSNLICILKCPVFVFLDYKGLVFRATDTNSAGVMGNVKVKYLLIGMCSTGT
jgi:hypothetical protein